MTEINESTTIQLLPHYNYENQNFPNPNYPNTYNSTLGNYNEKLYINYQENKFFKFN